MVKILLVILLGWVLFKNLNPQKFSPECKKSPNCATLTLKPEKSAHKVLKEILLSLERVEVVSATPELIHAVARSKTLGFKDDIFIFFPPNDGDIFLKSSARVGYYDFGVNEARLENIKEKYNFLFKKVE